MKFYVYILWSSSPEKFYAGSTSNLEERFLQHHRGQSKFTAKEKPWQLIGNQELSERPDAIRLENKVKKRGIKKYLEDINFDFSGCSAAR